MVLINHYQNYKTLSIKYNIFVFKLIEYFTTLK